LQHSNFCADRLLASDTSILSSTGAAVQQLLAFAVFAVGFFARPIGSLVLGMIGTESAAGHSSGDRRSDAYPRLASDLSADRRGRSILAAGSLISLTPGISASEPELQRELQHAWTSGRRDLPSAIRPEIVLGLREVHVIERVEKLRSKLKRHTLEEGEVLE
jgi:hypothetical protein